MAHFQSHPRRRVCLEIGDPTMAGFKVPNLETHPNWRAFFAGDLSPQIGGSPFYGPLTPPKLKVAFKNTRAQITRGE